MIAIPCLAALMLPFGVNADDPTAADEAIKEAITILEARKARATEKADQERIEKAIAGLEKMLGKAEDKKAAAKVEPLKVPPAVLAKKFAGKAALNPKTGELTLVYDMRNKDQFKDFDTGDAKLTLLKGGGVRIGAADKMTHVVRFKTLTVSAKFTVDVRPKDEPLLATEAAVMRYWEFNGLNVSLNSLGQKLTEKNFNRVGIAAQPVSFTISDKKVLANIHRADIAAPLPGGTAGRVTIFGGSGGAEITGLVISGMPEEKWAADFFGQ